MIRQKQNLTTADVADRLECLFLEKTNVEPRVRREFSKLIDCLREKHHERRSYSAKEERWLSRILVLEDEILARKNEMESLFNELTKGRAAYAVRKMLSRMRNGEVK